MKTIIKNTNHLIGCVWNLHGYLMAVGMSALYPVTATIAWAISQSEPGFFV
jgi:hypothetical protein